MKQAAFFITAFFTYYLAGMYRSLPMIVLCVMELLLYAMLFLLSRYFKRNLSAEFFKRGDSAEKSTELPCGVRVRNRGKLPAGRLEVCLRLTCGQDLEYEKKLCGGGEPGGVLWFGVLSPYCGLLRIQMNRIRVYDYLSLFSAGKPADDKMTIAVFPKERALRITFRAFGRSGDSSGEDQTARRIGDAHSEIRQIREYRAGDSNRHIHWNQSVRTDMLWTKEYETETDAPADVFLDAGGLREASAENAGAFYELLSALVLGLLQNLAAVRVHWHGAGGKNLAGAEVRNAGQCRDMLLLLYLAGSREPGEPPREPGRASSPLPDGYAFRLNSDLSWYIGQTLIYRFSGKDLDSEIEQKSFVISP